MLGIAKQDNLIKKSLKFFVFVALAFSPIVFSVKHIYFFTTEKYVLMASLGSVCFALLILYFLETKFSLDKRIKIFLGLSSALILWLLLSSFFGADPTTSFWSNFGRHTGVLTYFFGFIFFLSAVFIYNKETFFVPLQAFVLGGALATLSIYLGPALLDVDLLFLTTSAGGPSVESSRMDMSISDSGPLYPNTAEPLSVTPTNPLY